MNGLLQGIPQRLKPERLPLPRRLAAVGWISHPGAYALGGPLLNGLAILVGLVIPALLGPTEFGRYVVAELFGRYLVLADLGLVQLLDRRIPPLVALGKEDQALRAAQEILWARIIVGGAFGATIVALFALFAFTGSFNVALPAALCSAAYGLLSLIAVGPVGVWRAASHYRSFTLSFALLNIGLSIPRLIGALLGGVTGCFLLLAIWYGLGAICLHSYMPLKRATRPSLRRVSGLVAESLPLFAAGLGWALYLVANRLIYSTISRETELGHFAFGSSILTVLVISLAMPASAYYPKLAGKLATADRFRYSRKILRDFALVSLVGWACSACAIILIPRAITQLYPAYVEAADATRILLASCPPIVVAFWLMQLIVAIGRTPWADALTVYPASLMAVAVGIIGGHAVGGMCGAAAGSVAGSLVYPLLELLVLRRCGVILASDAILLFLLIVIVTGMLLIVGDQLNFVPVPGN